MSQAPACLHAIVDGYVQGVGFRAFVLDEARGLELAGWVRNKGEEQVEVWAEGPRLQLERLLDALRRGPSAAHVSSVQESWPDPTGKYSRFSVASSSW